MQRRWSTRWCIELEHPYSRSVFLTGPLRRWQWIQATTTCRIATSAASWRRSWTTLMTTTTCCSSTATNSGSRSDDSGEAVSTIRVLMRGLRGGAPEDPRSIIANILMAKGLSAQEARDKGDQVLARVPNNSVLAWLPKANWQTLKALVGTRVTFVNKSRKEKDPLMDKDPWMEAIRSKSTSSASTDKAPVPSVNPEAHVQLIPQVWLNDDGSHPQILERVQHGNTGLALLSPQQFENWIDVQLPLSCDELAIVVWPPLQTPPENLVHTVVTFPAHIQASTTTTTLLVGQLFQMGSKEIRLKEDPNPTAFPTRDSVSLMVEIFQENTDEARWQQCTSDPLGYIKAHVETCTEVQGHWGIRFWSQKGKPCQAREATKVSANILIDQVKLTSVLRTSGPSLWISPRTGQQSFGDYRPIWVPGPLSQVRIAHDKLPYSCGLIRSRKGFGIRVETSKYMEAYKILHPTGVAPTLMGPPGSACQYKLSPAPLGATAQDILDFLRKSIPSHTFAVRRQISPKAWLVASQEAIEQEYIYSTSGYVLLQPWSTGKYADPLRDAIVVGNPRVLRQATKGMDLGMSLQVPDPKTAIPERPPATGPVQDLVDVKIKQSEDRLLTLLKEHREKVAEQQEEVKNMVQRNQEHNLEKFENLSTSLRHQELELSKALDDVKQSNQQGREALEKSMSEQFANMLRELGKMGKRSPAPSPEHAEPQSKAPKNA